MTTFPGFTLPPELVALREQVRRIVRDELLPIEQRIDPDAPEIPEEDYRRLAEKTAHQSADAAEGRRAMLEKRKPVFRGE